MFGTAKRTFLRGLTSATQRGFTLIEIAIVLVVIGLIISGGLLAVSPVIQSAQVSETKQKTATVELAILGYVIANGCLPCPAQNNLAITNAAAGSSANGGGTYTGCNSTVVCTNGGNGIVPWITLGLSEADASDAWGHRLRYAVDPNLTDANSVQRTSTGAFPAFTSTIAMIDTGGTALNYTSIAYVTLSHGPDGSFSEGVQTGTAQNDKYGQGAGNPNQDQAENGDGDLTFSIGAYDSTDSVQHFDDIVSFKSFQTLILSCGAGSCGNPS